MTYQPSWKQSLRIAEEPSFGGSPTAGNYNEGGDWFSLLSPRDTLKAAIERTRVRSRVGARSLDQFAPVAGARGGGGSLETWWASDIGGLLLKLAMGALSSAQTADAANPLLAATAIVSDPQTLEPSDPTTSAFLKFTLASSCDVTSLVTTGTDPDDNDISETVNTSGDGAYYTRKSFHTITSVVASGGSTGTVQVDGYVKATHTATLADTQPSCQLERLGALGATPDTNSQFFKGQYVNGLRLAFVTTDLGGLLAASLDVQGLFPTEAAQSTFQVPVHLPVPAWQAVLTRGGVAYARLHNFELNLRTGVELKRPAAGSQDPQGAVFGGRTVEGRMQVYVEDEDEFDWWVDGDVSDFEVEFDGPYKLDATNNHRLLLELTETYVEDVDEGAEGQAQSATLNFYTKAHASDDALKATVVNSVYSY